MPSTIGVVASSFWSPLDLTPQAWFDASDAATITASGSAVTQWNDKSSNGRNLTQGTGSRQPTTGSTTQNGLNVINFDGGDVLTRASVTINQPYTVCAVWKYNAGLGASDVTVAFSMADLGAYATYIGTQEYRIFNNTLVNSAKTANTDVHQVTSIHNTTSSEIRVDGTLVAGPADAGAGNGARLNVGAASSTAQAALNGWIAELLVFGYVLSADQVSVIESYLNDKWGL